MPVNTGERGIIKMILMKHKYDDGGRKDAGYKGLSGDCVCRALSIASGQSYQDVYDLINERSKVERITKRKRSKSSARDGVFRDTSRWVGHQLGLIWVPTMTVGSGCKVHLRADELPMGRLAVKVSKHYTAVIDRVIHDTHNPDRAGTRCVYGFFIHPDDQWQLHIPYQKGQTP